MNFTREPIARRTFMARVTRVAVAVAFAQTLATTCLVSTAVGDELIAGIPRSLQSLSYTSSAT